MVYGQSVLIRVNRVAAIGTKVIFFAIDETAIVTGKGVIIYLRSYRQQLTLLYSCGSIEGRRDIGQLHVLQLKK
jgi:hypothetical protein